MKQMLELNMRNLKEALDLMNNVPYAEFEDIDDIKDYIRKIYYEVNICYKSLEFQHNGSENFKRENEEKLNELSEKIQESIDNQDLDFLK